MTVVVDANVAVKWFIEQNGSDHARRVQAYRGPLIAPGMLVSEMANGLWRHAMRGDVHAGDGVAAISALPWWFHELVEDHLLAETALTLAIELDYATYDCFYLALSRARAAPLVTADKCFINRLDSTAYASNVVHLSDWT
jgi:predicted nucleic acid-binding protein